MNQPFSLLVTPSDSSLDKLERRLNQQLTQLCLTDFRCEADALLAADRFAKKLQYHCLEAVTVWDEPSQPTWSSDSASYLTLGVSVDLLQKSSLG